MTDRPAPSPEIVVFRTPRWMVRNFELLSVVVMSLTAILTAWSGFQSAQWSAVQAGSSGDAANDQTESVRASNEGEAGDLHGPCRVPGLAGCADQ